MKPEQEINFGKLIPMLVLVSLTVGLLLMAVVTSSPWSAKTQRHHRMRASLCIANQKALLEQAVLWADAHDGTLPTAAGFWDACPLPPATLQCPAAFGKSTVSYGYNAAVAGIRLGEMAHPEAVVVIADCTETCASGQGNALRNVATDIATRHNGQAILAFADGHVEASQPRSLDVERSKSASTR